MFKFRTCALLCFLETSLRTCMLHAVWMKVSGLAQEVAAACAREAAEGYVTKVC